MRPRRINVYEDRLLGVADLSRLFGCHFRTVYARIKAGSLPPPIKIGGRLKWRAGDIESALDDAQSKEASR